MEKFFVLVLQHAIKTRIRSLPRVPIASNSCRFVSPPAVLFSPLAVLFSPLATAKSFLLEYAGKNRTAESEAKRKAKNTICSPILSDSGKGFKTLIRENYKMVLCCGEL